jgi:hypothetical protein
MYRNLVVVVLVIVVLALSLPITDYILQNQPAFTADNLLIMRSLKF